MKKKIHPEYKDTTIVCACGETIQTKSTKQNIHIDICSQCHPFFTGKQKLIDSAGRVDKFLKRYEKKQPAKSKKKEKVEKTQATIEEKLDKIKENTENQNG